MYFGENVREIVSISCGKDLRAARSRTVLPDIESPEVQRRLAANLERCFGISLSPEDVSHLTTVRAVLQCVRLRRWERELATHDQPEASAPVVERAIATSPAPSIHGRFVRYTPPSPSSVHMPATAPPVAIRRS